MVSIMIMSGVDDGLVLNLDPDTDGEIVGSEWIITIGRRDENDITLKHDSFVSRSHARLCRSGGTWYLVDNDSKNGTFLDEPDDDRQVEGRVPLQPGQLFRIGRTWLRLHTGE